MASYVAGIDFGTSNSSTAITNGVVHAGWHLIFSVIALYND